MKELIENERFRGFISIMKPIAQILIVVVILRYTGILNGISVLTNKVLFKTGVMDIKPENNAVSESFNYDFTLKSLDGNTIDVQQFKGKVVFLNMWATWCGPCRAEMGSIQELYNKVDKNKIAFIMLSLDKEGNTVKKYIDNKQFTFPVFMPSGNLPEQLQVTSIPTTFVIDTKGKIVTKKVGTANYDSEKFKTFLEELIIK